MTSKAILKVNQRLEIWLLDKPDEHFGSRIEEIHSDYMAIAMPMSKGYPVMLMRGGTFGAKLIADGVVYQFTCSLINKKVQPLPLWLVSLPFDIKKVQLRSFVRVAACLPVQVKVILPDTVQPNTVPTAEQPLECKMLTKDISGGGVQLVSKQALKAGTKVELLLEVPLSGTIPATGEVVRVQQPSTENPVFWIGVKFLNIQEKDRSKLIKYIFKKQLEQRQKGL